MVFGGVFYASAQLTKYLESRKKGSWLTNDTLLEAKRSRGQFRLTLLHSHPQKLP